MCRLRNIALRDYQESVTTRQTDRQTHVRTDARQSDPYVQLCLAGDTKSILNIFVCETQMPQVATEYIKANTFVSL